MKVLGIYKNGNYTVTIFDDGTKVRENDLDNFDPVFSENCDVKITDKCSQGCPFCYEGCTSEGKHASLMGQDWIYHMHPFTELAINGNDLDHPELPVFLELMRRQKVIVNMTVNQNQFMQHKDMIVKLITNGFIKGVGISLRKADADLINVIKDPMFSNVVIHTINGILSKEDVEMLSDINAKLLILGYKNVRRGISYNESHSDEVANNQKYLYDNIGEIINHFNVVSFDNLSLEQLNIKRLLKPEEWDEFYMGDDGQFTFYIDAVAQTFAKNSVLSATENFPIDGKTIDEMFNFIKEKYSK